MMSIVYEYDGFFSTKTSKSSWSVVLNRGLMAPEFVNKTIQMERGPRIGGAISFTMDIFGLESLDEVQKDKDGREGLRVGH